MEICFNLELSHFMVFHCFDQTRSSIDTTYIFSNRLLCMFFVCMYSAMYYIYVYGKICSLFLYISYIYIFIYFKYIYIYIYIDICENPEMLHSNNAAGDFPKFSHSCT